MFKVSSFELIKIVKLLDKSLFAINTLERLGQNRAVFLETKEQLFETKRQLIDRYGLEGFDEWKNQAIN